MRWVVSESDSEEYQLIYAEDQLLRFVGVVNANTVHNDEQNSGGGSSDGGA